jgi:hypothetical protein
MTNLEIQERIDKNNVLIEEMSTPGQFVLNSAVSELLRENAELQKQCKHNFVNGYCRYCYKEEEKE